VSIARNANSTWRRHCPLPGCIWPHPSTDRGRKSERSSANLVRTEVPSCARRVILRTRRTYLANPADRTRTNYPDLNPCVLAPQDIRPRAGTFASSGRCGGI
jgi:hypothetical protein